MSSSLEKVCFFPLMLLVALVGVVVIEIRSTKVSVVSDRSPRSDLRPSPLQPLGLVRFPSGLCTVAVAGT